MTRRNIYEFRKNSGLCVRCGKIRDMVGVYCIRCNDLYNEYRRNNRKYLREHNICTMCGKEPTPREERICPECLAKQNAYRKPLTDEQRERQNEKFRIFQNERYRKRKEQGLCTRCGKRKAEAGKTKCGLCLAKDAEVQRQRRWKEKEAM